MSRKIKKAGTIARDSSGQEPGFLFFSKKKTSRNDCPRFERAIAGFLVFFEEKNKPAASYSRTGESRTTLGDGALDFRVRNGNGYDNSSMATGKREMFESSNRANRRIANNPNR